MSTPALPHRDDCTECAGLKAAESTARRDCDRFAEAHYRVLARRHLRTVHGVESLVVERA